MKDIVFETSSIHEAHLVDEALLESLQNQLLNQANSVKFGIVIHAQEGVEYNFSNLDELIRYSKNTLFQINSLEVSGSWKSETELLDNSISVTFYNDPAKSLLDESSRIIYRLDNKKDFYLVKKEIEETIHNNKTLYSFLTRVPLVLGIVPLSYALLKMYSLSTDKFFPDWIWILILAVSILFCLASLTPLANRQKIILFPRNDFSFGLLRSASLKSARIRCGLGGAITFGLGLLCNYLIGVLW